MNGYTQIELGGVKRGIKFGNRALLSVMQKHQVTGGIQFSFELVCDLIYFGMLNNCQNKKTEPDFTEAEVIEWVDDMPMAKLTEVFESFQGSFTTPGDATAVTKTTATKKKP